MDKVLLHFILKNKQLLPQIKKKISYYEVERYCRPLLIIPEERNIPLKFKGDHLPDDHAKLVKSYKADLSLPLSPILPENHCSTKLLELMTRDDKKIWDLIETKKTKRPMGIHGSYMKNFANDLHGKDDQLILEDILVASKGSLEEHKAIVFNIVTILDKNNMAVKWGNVHFSNLRQNG